VQPPEDQAVIDRLRALVDAPDISTEPWSDHRAGLQRRASRRRLRQVAASAAVAAVTIVGITGVVVTAAHQDAAKPPTLHQPGQVHY
jgi:negative regulator of sigma E activity